MEYLGIIFELIFLAIGIYLYLFSRGIISAKDPRLKAKAEAFRKENAGWMRILSLLLIAVMSLDIVAYIVQLLR